MKRRIMLLAAALLASGCIRSVTPLSDPDHAVLDPALEGLWVHDDANAREFVHVMASQGTRFRIVKVSHPNTPDGEAGEAGYDAFPTEYKGQRFLNVLVQMHDEEPRRPDDGAEAPTRYCFFKYEVRADHTLAVWELNYEQVKEAVEEKVLSGRAWETTWTGNAVLTGTREELLQTLTTRDSLWARPTVYRRLDVSP